MTEPMPPGRGADETGGGRQQPGRRRTARRSAAEQLGVRPLLSPRAKRQRESSREPAAAPLPGQQAGHGQGDPPTAESPRRPVGPVPAVAAGAVLLAAGITAAVVLVHGHGAAGGHRLTASAPSPVLGQPGDGGVPVAASPARSASPGRSATPTRSGASAGTPKPGGSAPGSGQQGGAGSGGSAGGGSGGGSSSGGSGSGGGSTGGGSEGGGGTAGGGLAPGTLSVPSIVPCPLLVVQTHPEYTCTFTVSAAGGSVSYSLSEPSAETSEYTMNFTEGGSGTLAATDQASVSVTVTGPIAPPTSQVPSLTAEPGGASIQFNLLLPAGN